MLRELTWEQLQEWQEYDRISPVGDRRSDWQAASVCAAVINSSAALKGLPPIVQVSDMLLEFTTDPKVAPVVKPAGKSEAEMKFIARMCVAMSDAEEDKAAKKKKRR